MSSAAATRQGDKASSFAMTCNRLSQFLKEKGRSFIDLGLGMPPMPIDSAIGRSDTYRPPPPTMSLLPGVDVSGNGTKEHVSDRNATKSMEFSPQRACFGHQTPATSEKRVPAKKQLTIFYGGKVLVFDNFPADKARDLMMLAGKGIADAKNASSASPSTVTPVELKNMTSNSSSKFVPAPCNPQVAVVQACPPRPARAIVSALPIARKASLHRFLEKRKDRINAKAPYQVNQVKGFPASLLTPNSEENQPWLQLKPSLSSEGRR